MLIITRRQGEEIAIGDDIRVVVVETGKSQIRIGVEAPHDIKINRRKIVEARNIEIRPGVEL